MIYVIYFNHYRNIDPGAAIQVIAYLYLALELVKLGLGFGR